MSVLQRIHDRIFTRRVRVLAEAMGAHLPRDARVLDVGCGDGALAANIMARRPDVNIVGADVLLRPHCAIPATAFDGITLPWKQKSFDAILFVDVLHHAADPLRSLSEAARVARDVVVVKDHLADAPLARERLRLMDWVGNARHGVRLPYTYWTSEEWDQMFSDAGLHERSRQTEIPLYPAPLSWIFGRALHMISVTSPSGRAAGSHDD